MNKIKIFLIGLSFLTLSNIALANPNSEVSKNEKKVEENIEQKATFTKTEKAIIKEFTTLSDENIKEIEKEALKKLEDKTLKEGEIIYENDNLEVKDDDLTIKKSSYFKIEVVKDSNDKMERNFSVKFYNLKEPNPDNKNTIMISDDLIDEISFNLTKQQKQKLK